MSELPATGGASQMRRPAELTEEQIHRYARHIILDEVGGEGQRKLLAARVLVVGAGGLGSPVALYLAAAGVGTIGIVDDDEVDLTNLQRQVLHRNGDIGAAKTATAARTIADLNPDVDVVQIDSRLEASNALSILEGYDLVVDGSDNFATRYLVNDACYLLHKPLVHGAIFRFEGQVTVFDRDVDGSPCYRCLFRVPPRPGAIPNCAQAGVFGVLAGTIGTLQATEVIKLVCGIGEPLVGSLLLYDSLQTRFTRVRVARDESCALSGSSPEITELVDYEELCR